MQVQLILKDKINPVFKIKKRIMNNKIIKALKKITLII